MSNLDLKVNDRTKIKEYIGNILEISPVEKYDSKSISYASERLVARKDETLKNMADLTLRYQFKIIKFSNDTVKIQIYISNNCEEFKTMNLIEKFVTLNLESLNLKAFIFTKNVFLNSGDDIVEFLDSVKTKIENVKNDILNFLNAKETQQYLEQICEFYKTFDKSRIMMNEIRRSYNDMLYALKKYPEDTEDLKNDLIKNYYNFANKLEKAFKKLNAQTTEDSKIKHIVERGLDDLIKNENNLFNSEGEIRQIEFE